KPPVAGGDQYSDFSPTKPNPAVNNFPGALVFAGDGPGREGTRSLFSGYYGAVAPRVSFAYSANDKTIIRGGVGRSFGRVTVVQDRIARFGPTATRDLLNSNITSAAAVAAGIKVPYPNFTNASVQRSRTVGQALRPYPQYLAVNVQSGGGDKTGRSHYHAGIV